MPKTASAKAPKPSEELSDKSKASGSSGSTEALLIGHSAAAKDLRHLVDVVAPSPSTVLILGETGVGKDVVTRALHAASGRKGHLVSVNCAAIPAELLESELFGHEKGAFTGADATRKGRFEMAEGGTLFLDEIGDMNLSLQSKLLRALENRTIQRVGGGKDISVDFRLICATHQNLDQLVDQGKFRADLFFRINVFPIHVPTLAERSVDIPMLLEHMVNQAKALHDGNVPQFDDSALSELARYPWPGNIRELRNVIERAFVLFPNQAISGKAVRENLLRLKVPDRKAEQDALWAATADLTGVQGDADMSHEPPVPHAAHYQNWFAYFDHIDLRRHLRDVEVVLIEAALEKTNGTISAAADALKLRRTTLIEKMKKLMIDRPLTPGEEELSERDPALQD